MNVFTIVAAILFQIFTSSTKVFQRLLPLKMIESTPYLCVTTSSNFHFSFHLINHWMGRPSVQVLLFKRPSYTTSTFEQLLEKSGTKRIHQRNLQFLMTEIYKTLNNLNPAYMAEFFIKKDLPYNLRKKDLCKLPAAKSLMFGTSSLSF